MDLLFFPIDTIKTRLQSAQGFVKAGGSKGIYKGIGSVVVGSAPGGALRHPLSVGCLRLESSGNVFFDIRHVKAIFAFAWTAGPTQPHDFRVYW